MVSDEPRIIEAHRPAKLSAPCFSNISAIKALLPPPENGRMITRGIISDGIPSFVKNGERTDETALVKPDDESIFTDTTSIIIVGRIDMQVEIPFFVPSKKSSGDAFFENTAMSDAAVIARGAAREEIMFVIFCTLRKTREKTPPTRSSMQMSRSKPQIRCQTGFPLLPNFAMQ